MCATASVLPFVCYCDHGDLVVLYSETVQQTTTDLAGWEEVGFLLCIFIYLRITNGLGHIFAPAHTYDFYLPSKVSSIY